MDDHPDIIEDTPRMRRVLEQESTAADERKPDQKDDSLPHSIAWNDRRGITPEQLEEGRR